MRRHIVCTFSFVMLLALTSSNLSAQSSEKPELRKLAVPASQTRAVATKLSLMYVDLPGVQISPDTLNEQLVVMAPEAAQHRIAADVDKLLRSEDVRQASVTGPVQVQLRNITWREFEDDLKQLAGLPLPITTSRNGERASFQINAAPMQGTTVEVDRRNNLVTVMAQAAVQEPWQQVIRNLDVSAQDRAKSTQLMRLEKAEPAPVQRAIRLLGELAQKRRPVPTANQAFRNALFQQDVNSPAPAQVPPGQTPAEEEVTIETEITDDEVFGGSGVIGDTQIQFVPELGTIIIRGAKRDVQRVMDVIREIEKQSEVTRPDIEVVPLLHADSEAVATLLRQIYDDVLSARQGEVSITALDSPNSLLLIGRTEAINGVRDLITKMDQPVEASARLRVFRLQHASAADAEETIREFFTARPGSDDELRPALGARVRVTADYRTNSLIVSAAPRDMNEVTRLINDLDVRETSSKSELKIFSLKNAVAEDLAPVIQDALSGEGESGGDGDTTTPARSLSITSIGGDANQLLHSGVLSGIVVTADSGANSIVVRAPADAMPLISELIRQLDKTPGIESLVKVFTIENGDAVQLSTSLTNLFGADAATTGTTVGAGNLGGLPGSTAGKESSLVPLRFSTDLRTNSIVASGSAEDLEVVESILLRLDSVGFAERITEVIWLRHQVADDVALAIQSYVTQRTTRLNSIQQFQQGGLGPYDLPDRDLIVVAEPTTNSLLLSVSPRLYEDVRRMIDSLDRRPPMVQIKVVLAEVTLEDSFELGGELGLQDSLLFDRGRALPDNLPNSTPGFNFNNSNTPNVGVVSPGTVGSRALSTFGLGTASNAAGYGGFVLSAASDSFSLLFRSLQDAGRAQILSRPQIMTVDNQTGFVQVGQSVARVQGLQQGSVNFAPTLDVADVDIGLILSVLPRVGADGLISMLIRAERSAVDDQSLGTPIGTDAAGNQIRIPNINRTTAESTITAYNGQTVVFGGLIQKDRVHSSRRVPYLSNIPLLGVMFRFDSEVEVRRELLVIMTPTVVNSDEDLEYVKHVESSRMSWCLADVVEMHGDAGLSGGYGLWGPATGGTIYPDLQPTVDHFHMNHGVQDSYGPYDAAPPVEILPQEAAPRVFYEEPAMLDSGSSKLRTDMIDSSSLVPEQSFRRMTPSPNDVNSTRPLEAGQRPRLQSPSLGSQSSDRALPPTVSGPAINPYAPLGSNTVNATGQSAQVSWLDTANVPPAGETSQAAANRPQRVGSQNLPPESQPSSDPRQSTPGFFPQTWIR